MRTSTTTAAVADHAASSAVNKKSGSGAMSKVQKLKKRLSQSFGKLGKKNYNTHT